jgi:cyclopropane fatty-acyl-phospholipid synthase-like methyltransferase
MGGPDAAARQRVIDYYRHWESRWGYALLLRGTKHFGYYPPGRERIRMAKAQTLMSDQLGRALALPAGGLALDAGCGQGAVALRLAERFRLRVEGIDILPGDIRRASRKAARRGAGDRVRFQVMDYGRLQFADGHFDGVYTMETLVHAADSRAVLAEFHRVLRPGGRLALFEYSMEARELLTGDQRQAFDAIIEGSAMHSLPSFVHGCFPGLLQAAGFEQVAVREVTERMLPMLRRLARLFWLPYRLGRAVGAQRQVVNAMSAVESWRHRAVWRYNVVTAAKPKEPDR